MADIDAGTAIIVAVIGTGSAIIGGVISSGTTFLIEWQRNRNEEKKRQQEEKTKEIYLRYQSYIRFLSIVYDDVHLRDENDNPYFDADQINEIFASVIAYGSPKVSSSLARSFPLKSWESIEKSKKLLLDELALEKGRNLSLSGGIENKEFDADMGKKT